MSSIQAVRRFPLQQTSQASASASASALAVLLIIGTFAGSLLSARPARAAAPTQDAAETGGEAAQPAAPSLAAHETLEGAIRQPQFAGTFEIGALLGIWSPSLVSGLGNSYFRYDVPGLAPLFGLRAGYQATRRVAIEVEGRAGSADLRRSLEFDNPGSEPDAAAWLPGGTASIGTLRIGARFDLLDRGPVFPFVRVMGGLDLLSAQKAFVQPGWDSDLALGAGVGARFRLTHRLRLRIDVDGWFAEPAVTRASQPSPGPGFNVAATAGLSAVLGGPAADEDGDGVPDAVDQCPDTPEDKDGFSDADGCPDRDNDGDAIPDASDKCPMEAEDDDHFEDNDGCPDLDNDGDGIADAQDKCPNVAEDKDGFQDSDGCPDLDDDGDGIADSNDRCPREAGVPEENGCPSTDPDRDGIVGDADRCPNEAETYNGEADDDGCPDTPALVRAEATGITLLRPLDFRGNRLDRRSSATLRAIATVLTRFGWPRLSVEVHSDDRDTGAHGRALTSQRADVVRAALVKLGVAADRLDARGYGDSKPSCHEIDALLAAKPRDKAAVAVCRSANARVELRVPAVR